MASSPKKSKKKKKQQKQKQNTGLPKPWSADYVKYLLAILGLTFIFFSSALDNEFVNWDDDVNIYNNVLVTEPLSIHNIKEIFLTDVIGGYNPLTILSFAVENQIFGENPKVHHITNVLLHLACTFFVFWMMLLMGVKKWTAAFIAILFGIHPMRVESVAWATERKDVLFGFFYLASIVCYLYFIKTKEKKYFWWIVPLFILSLLSKIQAVSLPLSLLALDYYFNREMKWKLIIEKIPFFLLSLAIGIIGISLLKGGEVLDSATQNFALHERTALAMYSMLVYIVKSIVPYQLVCIYPYPESLELIHFISIPIAIALFFLVYKSHKKTRGFVFGFAFFFFNIAFVLQFFGAGQGFLADRFTYIPYIGLFFILGISCQWLMESRPSLTTVLKGGMGVFVLIMGVMTYSQSNVWQNSLSLWNHCLEYYQAATAYNNRGRYYKDNKQTDLAMADFSKTLEINPKSPNVYLSRGRIYYDRGDLDLAKKDNEKGLELDPDNYEMLTNQGAIIARLGNHKDAIPYLDRAEKIKPSHLEIYINRMLSYNGLGDNESAIRDADKYLSYKNNPEVIGQRGFFKRLLGRDDEALADYNESIKLDSSNGALFYNRSRLYFDKKNFPLAKSDALMAQKLGYALPAGYLDAMGN